MSRKKNLFNLFKKRLANGTEMYYYTCYDETGKRRQFSTGERDIQEAYKICYERLAAGKIVVKSKLNFSEYTKDIFIYDKCPYYTVRMAKGRTYSRSSIENKRKSFMKHILPYFGGMRLDYISPIVIEEWLKQKKSAEYALNTINMLLSTLNLILGEAKRTGLIDRNPCENVVKFSNVSKERGILTEEETEKLFQDIDINQIWKDHTHYIINYTASITGCRIGEILALTADKVHDGYLEVSSSWDRKYGIKSTKNSKPRFVPISDKLQKLLLHQVYDNSRFLFPGANPLKPITCQSVSRVFKQALEKIGITEEERKARNITFHSYRHYANTRFRKSGLPDAVTRAIIGHSSSAMTENYSHIDTRTIRFSDLKIV